MQFNEIRITKRVQTADYEHEEVTISASLLEGETVEGKAQTVMAEVRHALGLAVDPMLTPAKKPAAIAATVTKTPDVEADKAAAATKKAAADKIVADKAAAAEAKKVEAADKKAEKEKIAAEKKAATALKKTVQYNRNEQSHKTEFAKILTGINANWKKEAVPAAQAASLAMEGKPMLDGEGKVLPEFVEALTEAFAPADVL